MDCIVHEAAKSQTQLSDFHFQSCNNDSSTISALLTMPKALIVWITINCGKF